MVFILSLPANGMLTILLVKENVTLRIKVNIDINKASC